jgi:hypothetical protein
MCIQELRRRKTWRNLSKWTLKKNWTDFSKIQNGRHTKIFFFDQKNSWTIWKLQFSFRGNSLLEWTWKLKLKTELKYFMFLKNFWEIIINSGVISTFVRNFIGNIKIRMRATRNSWRWWLKHNSNLYLSFKLPNLRFQNVSKRLTKVIVLTTPPI